MTHTVRTNVTLIVCALLVALLAGGAARAGDLRASLPESMSFARQPIDTPELSLGQPNILGLNFFHDPRPSPSFGFSADRWWSLFKAPDRAGAVPVYIRIDSPSSDRLAAFERCANAPWQKLPRIRARYAVFETRPQAAGCDLLLLEESRAPIRFTVHLLPAASLAETDNDTLIGVDLGIALAVSGMAGFLWRASRRTEFLHFIAYQAATALVILRIWGFVPGVLLASPAAAGGLIGIAGLNLWVLEFFNYVQCALRVPQARPKLHRWFYLLAASALLAIAGEALSLRFQWPLTVINMAAGISSWGAVVVLQWSTERRRAMQQVLGYTPVLASFVVYLFSLAGYAQLSDLRLLVLLGQIGTTLALGYWMALEFKQDRDRREYRLTDAIGQLQDNRAELERYQSDLESMVASRTDALQEALQNEREIVAQQRDFTAMVGHEFRTPLAVIDGQARRLARAETGEDDFTRRAREIRDAVRDMIGLMDGLLAHSRHTGGSAEYRFVTISVLDIFAASTRQAVPPDRRQDLQLLCPEEMLCRADPALLVTAISNILANAVKYSQIGSPIHVTARAVPAAIEISITDHGVGIAPAEQQAVFAKFQRGTNVLTTAGSGLGLFLASQIIDAHGGSIALASTLGQGSCFTVRLPAVQPATIRSDKNSVEAT